MPGSEFVLPCDAVVKAIGQEKPALAAALGLALDGGYIAVDGDLRTSLDRVWAGGDCVRVRGSASTVMAVQDGKIAAASMSAALGHGADVTLKPEVPTEVRRLPLYAQAHHPQTPPAQTGTPESTHG